MFWTVQSSLFSRTSHMAKPPCKVVVHGILLSRAVLLIEEESWIDSLPSVVLIYKEISLFFIKSTTCGLPSATLFIILALIPMF